MPEHVCVQFDLLNTDIRYLSNCHYNRSGFGLMLVEPQPAVQQMGSWKEIALHCVR